MRPFSEHEGIAVPLLRANVDTDAIIPSRELRRVSKSGLGDGLFSGWRYEYVDGNRAGPRAEFVLNRPEYAGASILLTGPNFGCGSSREHAVWALGDYGFRAVVAPSFGSIFQRNCYNNGLLAIVQPEEVVQALADSVAGDPQGSRIRIDLAACALTDASGNRYAFTIPEDARARLLKGLDEIDLTLRSHAEDISRYRARRDAERSWAAL